MKEGVSLIFRQHITCSPLVVPRNSFLFGFQNNRKNCDSLTFAGLAQHYNIFVVNLGKLILFVGAALILVGLLLMLLGRTQLPIGRLPGDIVYRRRNFAFYFPLTTSILLSIVLSLVFYFLSRVHR